MKHGGSPREGGHTEAIFGGGDGGFIDKDIATLRLFSLNFKAARVSETSAPKAEKIWR